MKLAKHIIGTAVAQGDVMLIPVEALPENGHNLAPLVKGAHIVTHSETGHNHVVMERPGVAMFQDTINQFRAWLVIEGEPAELEHLRSFDTHESVALEPGVWEVRRQQEYSPEGWRRAAD